MPHCLQILYSTKKNSLLFFEEDIQEIIFKNVDIKQVVICKALVGPYDDDFIEIRKLYSYSSFWDLVYLNDNYGYRVLGVDVTLKNGIRITTDLNLTTVFALTEQLLFDNIALFLTCLGLEAKSNITKIKSQPDEWVELTLAEDNKSDEYLPNIAPF